MLTVSSSTIWNAAFENYFYRHTREKIFQTFSIEPLQTQQRYIFSNQLYWTVQSISRNVLAKNIVWAQYSTGIQFGTVCDRIIRRRQVQNGLIYLYFLSVQFTFASYLLFVSLYISYLTTKSVSHGSTFYFSETFCSGMQFSAESILFSAVLTSLILTVSLRLILWLQDFPPKSISFLCLNALIDLHGTSGSFNSYFVFTINLWSARRFVTWRSSVPSYEQYAGRVTHEFQKPSFLRFFASTRSIK